MKRRAPLPLSNVVTFIRSGGELDDLIKLARGRGWKRSELELVYDTATVAIAQEREAERLERARQERAEKQRRERKEKERREHETRKRQFRRQVSEQRQRLRARHELFEVHGNGNVTEREAKGVRAKYESGFFIDRAYGIRLSRSLIDKRIIPNARMAFRQLEARAGAPGRELRFVAHIQGLFLGEPKGHVAYKRNLIVGPDEEPMYLSWSGTAIALDEVEFIETLRDELYARESEATAMWLEGIRYEVLWMKQRAATNQ